MVLHTSYNILDSILEDISDSTPYLHMIAIQDTD